MIETTRYSLVTHVPEEPAEAEQRVRDALAAEGFGVLAEIDVQATLLAKLGEDIGSYKILGACNPDLGRRAIAADADVGALLPCNVVIRAAAGGGSDVLAADPDEILGLSDEAGMGQIAADARARVSRALEQLATG